MPYFNWNVAKSVDSLTHHFNSLLICRLENYNSSLTWEDAHCSCDVSFLILLTIYLMKSGLRADDSDNGSTCPGFFFSLHKIKNLPISIIGEQTFHSSRAQEVKTKERHFSPQSYN